VFSQWKSCILQSRPEAISRRLIVASDILQQDIGLLQSLFRPDYREWH
jgi:hypothetical protein